MRKLVFFIVLLVAITGCNVEDKQEENADKQADDLPRTEEMLNEQEINRLTQEVSQLETELYQEKNRGNKAEEERDVLLQVNEQTRKYLQAMLDKKMDSLETLTHPSLLVFEDRIEKVVDQEIVEVYFSDLQTEAFKTEFEYFVVEDYGYIGTGEFGITYQAVDEQSNALSSVELALKEDEGRWKVSDISFFLNYEQLD